MAESSRPVQNRRRNMRRPSKNRVRVTCRRGGLDLGPNLGLAMVDLCEAGVRLVVKEPLEPGCAVSVGLEGQSHSRPTLRHRQRGLVPRRRRRDLLGRRAPSRRACRTRSFWNSPGSLYRWGRRTWKMDGKAQAPIRQAWLNHLPP